MRTPIADTATSEALLGRWALVYASEDPTRSSPFFWAFRCALCASCGCPFGLECPGVRAFGAANETNVVLVATNQRPLRLDTVDC